MNTGLGIAVSEVGIWVVEIILWPLKADTKMSCT
jgi:hypothetical protein